MEMNRYINYLIKVLVGCSIYQFPSFSCRLYWSTLTDLSAKNLLRLLRIIHDYLPSANDCEMIVEDRLWSFQMKKILTCIEVGVNRFSFGVQSFNSFVRRKVDRILTKEEIIERLEYVRDQTIVVMEIWKENIKTSLEFELDVLTYISSLFLGQQRQILPCRLICLLSLKKSHWAGTIRERNIYNTIPISAEKKYLCSTAG